MLQDDIISADERKMCIWLTSSPIMMISTKGVRAKHLLSNVSLEKGQSFTINVTFIYNQPCQYIIFIIKFSNYLQLNI